MAQSDLYLKQINADVTFSSGTTTIGSIPKSARITAIKALNVVANDAGTSAVISIGIAGSTSKYETAIDVKTATGDIATTLLTPVVPVNDEIIIVTLVEVGTAATVGSCTIVVEYVQN